MKTCNKCFREKSFQDFSRRGDGHASWCKSCVSENRRKPEVRRRDRASQRIWRTKPENREKGHFWAKRFRSSDSGKRYVKDYALRRAYGITLSDYQARLVEQQGCCAICGVSTEKLNRKLHVDHSHITGAVRDLLCHGCNTALGGFKEDVSILRRAIQYLERHETRLRLVNKGD